MILTRLIYCSTAAPNLDYRDLKDILLKSEKNNTPLGITGMLCFGNCKFLQVLEGNRKYVSETYNRIAQDQRHFNTEIIDLSEIDKRSFAEWSMKVLDLGSYAPDKIKQVSLRYSSLVDFDPAYLKASQSVSFLQEIQALRDVKETK